MDDKKVDFTGINTDENNSTFEAVAPKLIGETNDDASIDYTAAIKVDIVLDATFSFVLYCNKRHLIQDVVVKNITDKDIRGLRLEIKTDNELIDAYKEDIALLPANTPIEIRRPNLIVHGSYIATLTEQMDCVMTPQNAPGPVTRIQISAQISDGIVRIKSVMARNTYATGLGTILVEDKKLMGTARQAPIKVLKNAMEIVSRIRKGMLAK